MKAITVRKSVKDPEISELFNQMVSGDPDIIVPKHEEICNQLAIIGNILKLFVESPFAKLLRENFENAIDDIGAFAVKIATMLPELQLEKNDHVLTSAEIVRLNSNPKELEKYLRDSYPYKVAGLVEKFKALKDSIIVQETILTLRKLTAALSLECARKGVKQTDLDDKDALLGGFITNCDGDYLPLLSFSALDFRQIYYQYEYLFTADPETEKYMLRFLCIIYKRCCIIRDRIMSPDINVDKFSEMLVGLIQKNKSRIPRCERAFAILEKSVGLLKSNFGEYHKDFVSSQNPLILLERFILDVANTTTKKDISLTSEFRTIMGFYRKNMKNANMDPKAQKLMDIFDKQMDLLEKNSDEKGDQ